MRYNKAIFGGNLGADAILHTKDESTYVIFRVATTDSTGETLWIDCLLRGKRAERLHQYLKKGVGVIVDGRIALREYRANTGELKAKVSLLVDNLEFAGGRMKAEEPAGEAQVDQDDLQF